MTDNNIKSPDNSDKDSETIDDESEEVSATTSDGSSDVKESSHSSSLCCWIPTRIGDWEGVKSVLETTIFTSTIIHAIIGLDLPSSITIIAPGGG